MISRKGWLAAAAIVLIGVGAVLFSLRRPAATSLVDLLPARDGLIFHADLTLARKSGLLEKLGGEAGLEDRDYLQFVQATGFDYRRDLDAVAVASLPQVNYMAARGRFDRNKIEQYLRAQGGRCGNGGCSLPGTEPGRITSLRWLGPDLLALASSADDKAAQAVRADPGRAPLPIPVPDAMAWVYLPSAWNAQRSGRTAILQGVNEALDGANYSVFSVEMLPRPKVLFFAQAEDEASAERIASRWQQLTRIAGKLPPLPEFLKPGEFRQEGATVRGEWLVSFGS
jgi:hypothetical protein